MKEQQIFQRQNLLYLFLFKNFRISAIDENLLSKSFLRISKHLVLEVNLRIDQQTENVFYNSSGTHFNWIALQEIVNNLLIGIQNINDFRNRTCFLVCDFLSCSAVVSFELHTFT